METRTPCPVRELSERATSSPMSSSAVRMAVLRGACALLSLAAVSASTFMLPESDAVAGEQTASGFAVAIAAEPESEIKAGSAPAKKPKTRALFDGESFVGWEGDTQKTWRIEENCLCGGSMETLVPENEFLCTEDEFGDFELRFQYKLVGTEGFINGGVQIRSQRVPNSREMSGYQADIGAGYDGALYDESRRNKFLAEAPKELLQKVLKVDDWNDYRVRCKGKRIQLWINGQPTVDYTETDDGIAQRGKIGLQIHGGCKAVIRFRKLEIEELSAADEATAEKKTKDK